MLWRVDGLVNDLLYQWDVVLCYVVASAWSKLFLSLRFPARSEAMVYPEGWDGVSKVFDFLSAEGYAEIGL